MYAPSFILDVPASSFRDENTDEYLTKVDATFENVAKILRTQLAEHNSTLNRFHLTTVTADPDL
jgi:hypothetical protein